MTHFVEWDGLWMIGVWHPRKWTRECWANIRLTSWWKLSTEMLHVSWGHGQTPVRPFKWGEWKWWHENWLFQKQCSEMPSTLPKILSILKRDPAKDPAKAPFEVPPQKYHQTVDSMEPPCGHSHCSRNPIYYLVSKQLCILPAFAWALAFRWMYSFPFDKIHSFWEKNEIENS